MNFYGLSANLHKSEPKLSLSLYKTSQNQTGAVKLELKSLLRYFIHYQQLIRLTLSLSTREFTVAVPSALDEQARDVSLVLCRLYRDLLDLLAIQAQSAQKGQK